MRILSFSTVYPNPVDKGLGIFVRARLQRMAAGAEIKVLAPVLPFNYKTMEWKRGVGSRRQDEAVEVLHPRWLYIPGMGVIASLFLFLRLVVPVLRLRREFPFDLIDAHFGYPESIVAAMLSLVARTPFTVTLRGSELLHGNYPLRRFLMRWALGRATRVIAVSEELRKFAIQMGVEPSRAVRIANGIDASIFFRRDGGNLRQQYGIPADTKIVITSGHLIELKGHHIAVEAVSELRRRGIPAQLWITGGEPGPGVASYKSHIRHTVARLGMEEHVRFWGQVCSSQLAELMSMADVFCLASSREGFPNVVQEALACATPVVATRVGAIPEILDREGLGLIVPPGNLAAMTDALEQALTTNWDHERIAACGRARSWEQVAAEALQQWGLGICGDTGSDLSVQVADFTKQLQKPLPDQSWSSRDDRPSSEMQRTLAKSPCGKVSLP